MTPILGAAEINSPVICFSGLPIPPTAPRKDLGLATPRYRVLSLEDLDDRK